MSIINCLIIHFFQDILFCIGTDGKPVSIPESIKKKTVFHDFKKPPELGKWFAVMILVRNSVLYYSNEYNGLTMCKIRQLKKLGYEPIVVSIFFVCHLKNNSIENDVITLFYIENLIIINVLIQLLFFSLLPKRQ